MYFNFSAHLLMSFHTLSTAASVIKVLTLTHVGGSVFYGVVAGSFLVIVTLNIVRSHNL